MNSTGTTLSIPAKLFIAWLTICAIGVIAYAAMHRGTVELLKFAAFLLITLLAARLNVRLPRLTGSMSVNLPFILIALTQLSLLETVLVGCSSALIQSFFTGRKTNAVKLIFNFGNMAVAIGLGYILYTLPAHNIEPASRLVLLAAAAGAYFLGNTVPVAIIIGLTEHTSAIKVWARVFLWTYPYYLVSAGVASVVTTVSRFVGWQTALFLLPVVVGMYCSYRRYFATSSQTAAGPAPMRATAAQVGR